MTAPPSPPGPSSAPPLPITSTSSTLSPIRPALLHNLASQTHLISLLLSSLSAPSPSSPSVLTDTYAALAQRTSELESLVDSAWAHQAAHAALERQRGEVLVLERRVRGLARALWVGKEELGALVRQGKGDMEVIERVVDDPLPVKDLIAHAIALSKTSSASASATKRSAPAERGQQVPWPTEMTMRQGLLFQMEGSMVPLGEKGTIGDEHKPEVQDLAPAQPVHREENERRYDPHAVFQLDLGSDSEDDEA